MTTRRSLLRRAGVSRSARKASICALADLGYGVLDTAMVEMAAYCLERTTP